MAKRMYLRGNTWWVQGFGKRVSTGCEDRAAAEVYAASFELRCTIVKALRNDPLLREQVETALADMRRSACRGYLYGIKAGANIKLGFTSHDPSRRIRALQTGQALPLELVALVRGTRRDERKLHQALAHARVAGEWFRGDDPAVLAWVSSHRYTPRIPHTDRSGKVA